MKKRTSENTQRSPVNSYRPESDDMNGENWFANHKKLLWGIGGAVVLGTGAFLLLKNKNGSDNYSDTYDELNTLEQNVMKDLEEEDIIITTVSEFE